MSFLRAGERLGLRVEWFINPWVLLINALFLLILWWAFHQLSLLSEHLLMTKSVDGAAKVALMLKEFRSVYSREVVATVRAAGLPVTHDYHQQAQGIPLPATMTQLLGQRIGQDQAGFKCNCAAPIPSIFATLYRWIPSNSKPWPFFNNNRRLSSIV